MARMNIAAHELRKLASVPEELRLVCHKCNKEWMEKRPKGYRVRYKKGTNYLVNRRFKDMIESFKCPKCGNIKSIGRLTSGTRFHI